MAYRIVEITKPAECHVNNHQLIVEQEDYTVQIPVEDIEIILYQRHSAFLKMQINLSEDFKNCLWNKIIRQKINNSSRNLAVLGCDGVKEIESYVSQVHDGDRDNIEAQAAAVNFQFYHFDYKAFL